MCLNACDILINARTRHKHVFILLCSCCILRGVCCKSLEAICGHYWPAMSGNWYELNSLAWIAGGSTLKAEAGSVLVVVITTLVLLSASAQCHCASPTCIQVC